jgi:hypothetical protein
MRRVYLACFFTVLSIATLIGFKAKQSGPATDLAADPGGATGGAPPGGALGGGALGGTPTTKPSAATPSGGAHPSGTPSTGSATPSGSASGSPKPGPSSPSSTTPPPPASRTVSGFTCNTRYGSVRVSVTVTGSHIDNVSYVDRTSQPRGAPSALKTEVLNEQSAQNLTVVSGATYTSAAFMASVQNALYGSPLNRSVRPFDRVSSCG